MRRRLVTEFGSAEVAPATRRHAQAPERGRITETRNSGPLAGTGRSRYHPPMTQAVVAESRLRVRYAETDQMGYAYYANYFVWFEVGRTDLCRIRGFTYADLERETGTFLPVIEAECRYRLPLRYDDELTVRTWVEEFRSRGMTFRYEVLNEDGEIAGEGRTRHIFVGARGRPRTFPESYRRLFVDG
jgi:acyl-CoA thioester hydrolase